MPQESVCLQHRQRTGGADQQDALGDASAHSCEPLRALQELHHLHVHHSKQLPTTASTIMKPALDINSGGSGTDEHVSQFAIVLFLGAHNPLSGEIGLRLDSRHDRVSTCPRTCLIRCKLTLLHS